MDKKKLLERLDEAAILAGERSLDESGEYWEGYAAALTFCAALIEAEDDPA